MTIEELHDRIYEILGVVDTICKKNGIRYWMHGGSAIGAVREHDFIPWDDDMDILILAEDYKAFKNAMLLELPGHLHFVEPEDCIPYFFDFIPRIVDNRWMLREETTEDKAYNNCNNRVCIDVFILGGCPRNGIRQKLWLLKYNVLYGMGMKYRYHIDYSKYSLTQKCEVAVLGCVGKLFSGKTPEKIFARWRKFILVSDTLKTGTSMITNTTPQCYWRPMPTQWFQDTVYMRFRDLEVPVPGEYDKILRMTFGNYMVPERDEQKYITHFCVE